MLVTVVLGLALTVAACAPQAAQKPAPTTPAAGADAPQPPQGANAGQTEPKEPSTPAASAGPRISIEDESVRNPELAAFMKSVRQAAAARDKDGLLALVSDNVRYTFGEANGKASFIKHFKLDTDPAGSPLWADLDEILSLGGASLDDRLYFAPNFFVRFPEGYDQFEYTAVIADNVAVRESPDPQGNVLTNLGFTVVKVDSPQPVGPQVTVDGKSYGWVSVVLDDGRKGYILDKFVRHPLETRLGVGKTDDGKWQIQAFVAGD
ncbi:MAG: hypothetical protein ACM3ZA_06495 [Bacillota bacterium]